MRSNDFDKIAFVYDRLTRLFFGRGIVASQKYFLHKIPKGSKVLILGGGSGWILSELFALKPEVEVWYVDASNKMILLAREKLNDDKRVHFICGNENNIPDLQYDVIITNFFLDLFSESSLKLILRKVRGSLAVRGTWIVTDFNHQKWWHKITLVAMYLFFKVTSNVEANKLSNWNNAMQEIGGAKVDFKFFYRNFIEAAVFQF